MRRFGALIAFALVVLPATPARAGATVSIFNFGFTPAEITAGLGSTVTFDNTSPADHTSTSDGGFWNAGPIDGGADAAVELTSSGTFAYHCAIHVTMRGVVVVPLTVTPAGPVPVGTKVTVRFASEDVNGRTYVLERKRGAKPWRTVTLEPGATAFSFTPHRAGRLRFRAATVEDGTASGMSPRVLVRVTPS